MTDVSLDIETLGTEEGAIVLSIGAVEFDTQSDKMIDTFYVNIDVISSLNFGLIANKDTVDWWSDQERDKAHDMLLEDQRPLPTALLMFSDWLTRIGPQNIWAKPPKFDCGLLEAAYRATNIPVPWDHRKPLCVRTAIRMSGINEKEIPFSGTEHNALDDAIHQAKIVQRSFGVVL